MWLRRLLLVTITACSSQAAQPEPHPPVVAAPPPAPAAASAAEPAPAAGDGKLTMHRQQAGTADASGWYPAHSTHGKFGALMPAPFNDFEMFTSNEKTGAPMRIHAIGTQLPNGVKYLATCIEGGDSHSDALTTMPAQLAAGQPVRKLTVAGKPAVEFTVADQSMSVRLVELDTGLCMMTVEAQDKATLAIPPQADVQRMFASFKRD